MKNMPSASSTVVDQIRQIFDQEWEYRLAEDPLFATWSGDFRNSHLLPEISEAAFERRLRQAQSFLDRIQAIDPEALPEEERLNYHIFRRVLETQAADYKFRLHLMPVSRINGPQTVFPDLIQVTPFRGEPDYTSYIARLEAFADYANETIDMLRAGMRSGHVPPSVALRGIEASLRAHVIPDPSASVFAEPFRRIPVGISPSAGNRLQASGLAAIQKSIVPGFQALLAFMQSEYLPAARVEIGASALPDGKAFYEYCVRRYTTLDLTPEEVHSTGLQEVARIRAEMDEVIRQVGFQGDLPIFLQSLRLDPRFYVDTPEALLKEAALILKKMDGELPRLFKTLPRTPYGLRQTPAHIAPVSYSAYYFPPAGDLSTAGFYYVNTYDLKSRPIYEYEALSFHEAVPGHHLQLALQMELIGVPNFRRFSDMTAFIEGWALYAERLGLEVGFYQDPHRNFGRLIFEMWRACRLVVDTGIHSFGWTRQKAIDFMAENTALSLLNIENEVDRYISWPGQALAYKTGELKIRELRQFAEKELGPQFDLREFHEIVLKDGGIPLDILESKVRRWALSQKNLQ